MIFISKAGEFAGVVEFLGKYLPLRPQFNCLLGAHLVDRILDEGVHVPPASVCLAGEHLFELLELSREHCVDLFLILLS